MNNALLLLAGIFAAGYWLTLGDFDHEWVDPLDWLSQRKFHAAKIDPGVAYAQKGTDEPDTANADDGA